MQKHTKVLVISLLCILCIGAILFAWPKTTKAIPSGDRKTYISNLVAALDIKQWTKKELLQAYCKALTNTNIQDWLVDGNMYFTPKYSLFAAALCAPFAKDSGQPFNGGKDDLLKKRFSWNSFLGSIPNWCDPSSNMQDCDFSQLLPKIFSRIMNDHSILSIAWWTFGLQKDKTSNEDIRNIFSNGYFGNVGKICGDEKTDAYLGTKSSSNSKTALCAHPNTANYLDSYINKLKQQQSKIQTLEVSALQWQVDPKTCVTAWWVTGVQASLLLCSYNNSIPGDAGPNQTNLRYNELLFYKTLVAWLTTKLNDPNFGPIQIKASNTDESLTPWSDNERLNLQREIGLSEKAMTIMKQNIYNFRATFPLHIWLLAYYEDVVALRKSMAKMYTPIHQLYYKLRNVQAK